MPTSRDDAMAKFHRIFKKIPIKFNIATCTNAQLSYLPLRIRQDRYPLLGREKLR